MHLSIFIVSSKLQWKCRGSLQVPFPFRLRELWQFKMGGERLARLP